MSEPDYVTKREMDLRFEGSDKLRDSLRLADKEAVQKALDAADKAVIKAEEEARQWRNNANEWRGAMSDRERTFARADSLGLLAERVSAIEGRFMAIASIGTAFGVAGVLYAALT